MNLYELLDVSPSANQREIKKSYRRLLSNDGLSGQQFAVIEDAYATLSDDQLRQAYDEELKSESAAPHLPDPLPVETQALNPFTLDDPPPDEVELAEPVAESPKFDDKPTNAETAIPENEVLSSSSRPPRKRRGQRANANSWRTFIQCVAAALAAGPIAILILKFVFDRDPLNLWEEPPPRVMVRQPIDPGNLRGPSPSPTPPDKDNSNGSQHSLNPPRIEPEKPPQAGIPLPQTDTTLEPDKNIPERPRDARMPVPTDNELAGPLTRLERLFRDDYRKARGVPAALVALATELFMNGKLVLIQNARGAIDKEQSIERYAWYQVALDIIIESGDTVQLKNFCDTLSAEYQIANFQLNNEIAIVRFKNLKALAAGRAPEFLDDWKLLFQNALTNLRVSSDAGDKTAAASQLDLALEIFVQLQPELFPNPNDQNELNAVLRQLFPECISNSKKLIQNLHFELGLEVLHLARRIAIVRSNETEKARAEMIIAEFAPFAEIDREFEAAKLNWKNSPDNPQINSALAVYTILILGDWNTGLLFLAKGQDTILATIAKADNQAIAAARARNEPVIPSDEVQLFDKWLELFQPNDLDINRKEIIYRRTKFWFEQALPNLSPLQKLELEKQLNDLK